ncbi:ABC transporter permease subunit [Paenibacillus sp. LMG 31456]|uniref:ABC transporter permease subunit n=1 Tax=Paenibacillus foliorum TaxID=2654974 RepID=A0A972GQI7_9BACL|nr:sugar ABC transporter permease [Paenibacillus foliorum]NOU94325.1 ABC transporter permease subunit [Paenibacillus foliorum]
MQRSHRLAYLPYLCILPAFIGCLVFTVYPVIYLFYLSLYKVDLLSNTWEFVNIQNYLELGHSKDFLQVLRNSVIYSFFTVSISCCLSLVLAVVLNRPGRLHQFVQSAVFSPHIIPLVSVSLLWMWMMDKDYGLLNMVLQSLHLPKLMWIDSPATSLMSLILVAIWKSLGFNILLIIAGMHAIPVPVIEAARMDNANPITMVTQIFIPLLSPTLFFMLTVNIIASFQVFDSVKVLTSGGPSNSSNVLVYWIYQSGFEFYKFGEASTGAVILFVIVSIVTIANFLILRSRIHYH